MSPKEIKETIHAGNMDIAVVSKGTDDDYICLTDIARYRNADAPADAVKNWLRRRNTIEFLGLWEQLNNHNFKLVEFDQFKKESGANAFTLSPQKWISTTCAVGIASRSGRYGGGTYAHKDIAFEFASWISPEFKLYIIQDYQRLKNDENSRLSLNWNLNRELAKINYRTHADAVQQYLIPQLTLDQQAYAYANEADLLNTIVFGMTSSEWKKKNPKAEGNIRDSASLNQLLVLSQMEALNAGYISDGITQAERMLKLRQNAERLLASVAGSAAARRLMDKGHK